MNWQTLFYTALKFGGGYLVSQGVTTASDLHIATGVASAIIGLIWNHFHVKAAAPSTSQLHLFALALAPVIFLTACASSQVETAFKSESAVKTTVDAAMTAWGNYVATAHPSAAVEQKVEDAFNAYQSALEAAIDATAAAANYSGTNTVANASVAQADADVVSAAQDVINLIQSLGVKL